MFDRLPGVSPAVLPSSRLPLAIRDASAVAGEDGEGGGPKRAAPADIKMDQGHARRLAPKVALPATVPSPTPSQELFKSITQRRNVIRDLGLAEPETEDAIRKLWSGALAKAKDVDALYALYLRHPDPLYHAQVLRAFAAHTLIVFELARAFPEALQRDAKATAAEAQEVTKILHPVVSHTIDKQLKLILDMPPGAKRTDALYVLFHWLQHVQLNLNADCDQQIREQLWQSILANKLKESGQVAADCLERLPGLRAHLMFSIQQGVDVFMGLHNAATCDEAIYQAVGGFHVIPGGPSEAEVVAIEARFRAAYPVSWGKFERMVSDHAGFDALMFDVFKESRSSCLLSKTTLEYLAFDNAMQYFVRPRRAPAFDPASAFDPAMIAHHFVQPDQKASGSSAASSSSAAVAAAVVVGPSLAARPKVAFAVGDQVALQIDRTRVGARILDLHSSHAWVKVEEGVLPALHDSKGMDVNRVIQHPQRLREFLVPLDMLSRQQRQPA